MHGFWRPDSNEAICAAKDESTKRSALCPGPVKTEFAAVAGSTMSESLPDFAMVSAEEVARQAIDAMESGNRTAIPGMANQIQALLGRLAPRSLVLPLAGRVSKL